MTAGLTEENMGDSLGGMLSDYIPFLPSGARRAGSAQVLARRLGKEPGFLLNHPMLTQLGALGLGALGSAHLKLEGPASIAPPLLAVLAVNALRRHNITSLQDEYEGKKRHTRLRDVPGLDDAMKRGWWESPHTRLGRVLTYDAMKRRKYEPMGAMAEAGDALALAGAASGLAAPAMLTAAGIDQLEAEERLRQMKKASRFITEAELRQAAAEKRKRGKYDQRNNPSLPWFLAALGGSTAGSVLASLNMRSTGTGEPIDEATIKRLIKHITNRDIGYSEDADMRPNAFFHPGQDVITAHPTFATAPILAHEAGHARLEKEDSIPGMLQRNVYGFSSALPLLSGAGSLAAGLASGGPIRGGLLGALIGAGTGAGVLVPERVASNYGNQGLASFDGGRYAGDQSKASTNAAYLTYLAAHILPSVLAGAAGGYIADRRKKEQEEEAQTPPAAPVSEG